MKSVLIVIDGNFVSHSCRFANKVYHKGKESGVIYDILNKIIDLGETYHTNDVVIVWDSKHSWRKKKHSWYKQKRAAHRKELSEEDKEILRCMYRQVDNLQTIFPKLGFSNNLMQNGLEGDDLMAMICRNYPDRKIVLVANDHDLYQLLDSNVSMLSPKGEYLGKEYTQYSFQDEYGISPKLWHLVKALAGCASDEVPGIDGVGEKTVCKFLRNELKPTHKTYDKITCSDGQEIKERNLPLVRLPHAKTKPIVLAGNNFNWCEFTKLCKQFKFNDFLVDRRDEWERFFGVKK